MGLLKKAYDYVGEMLRLSDGGYTHFSLSPATYSGRPVTPVSSLQTVSVLRCATLLTGAGASLPIDVFEKTGSARKPLPDHPAEWLLDSTPNEDMSSMDVRAMLWMSFLLWGNAYARITWRDDVTRDYPTGLWPLQPDCVEIKRRENGRLIYLYTPPGKGMAVPYEPEDILHVRWFSLDGIYGLSAIAQARQAIGRNQDAEEYGARFFANGAKPSISIEYPQKLSDAAIKNLRDSFEATYGGVENAHRVAVFEQGAKISTFSVNPRDAQFLEQEQYNDEKIAMLFGIPPHMVGLVSKTTSWGTGIAEQKLGFLTFTLAPLLTFWEKAIERALVKKANVYVKHNLNAFLRADIKTRFEAYAIGIDKGLLAPNEGRALEDLDPYDGGDVHLVQSQYIPVQMAGKAAEAAINRQPGNGGVQ